MSSLVSPGEELYLVSFMSRLFLLFIIYLLIYTKSTLGLLTSFFNYYWFFNVCYGIKSRFFVKVFTEIEANHVMEMSYSPMV